MLLQTRLYASFVTLYLVLLAGGGGFSQTFSVDIVQTKYNGNVNVRCAGSSDGQATVSVSGGLAPITLLWNDGNTSHQRTDLSAGTYWVTATDSLGNIVSDTIVLNEPNTLASDAQRLTYAGGYHISKSGASDGQITVSVTGGVAPYQIIWQDSTHGFTKLNLVAGTYSYTILDANHCTLEQSVTLLEPAPLVVQVTVLRSVSCKEIANGSARVTVSGGVPPYKIGWSSEERDSIAYELGFGNQHVLIIDAQGAEWLEPFSISAPPTFQESILVSQYPGGYQVSCSNCFNGSIAVQVEGGTPPYTVIWEDTSDIPNPFLRQNLGGKLYHYSILDSNQCKIKGYVDLAEPKFSGWQLSGNTEIDANTQYLGTNDTSSFVVKTNAELALKINGAGNMGIGSEPSAAKLNVNGLLEGQGGIKLPNLNTFNDTASVSLQNFRLLAVDENGNFAKLGSSFPIADLLPNTKSCTQNAEGQFLSEWRYQAGSPALATIGVQDCLPMVGIGTTTPQARLDVNGNTFLREGLQIGGLTLSEPSETSVKINLPTSILTSNTTGLSVETSNAYSLSVKNQQSADGATAVKIEVDRDNTYALQIRNANNAVAPFYVFGNGTTVIGDESAPINTDYSKLKVYGVISSRGLRVTEGVFPDFVFNATFPKPDIEKIQTYVLTHKHLPGVMSEKDVKAANGFELGELSLQSLQKIEELYLIIFELNERVAYLEDKLR